MSIRITGMFSGLDTESIITELVSAQSVKKNSLVKAQTKLSWKQDAWKALNTKIYDFYTNTLSDMRYQGSYMKKTTKLSNTNAISVITSDSAVDGVRSVKVNKLAKGARLTGGSLVTKDGVAFSGAANLSQLLKNRGKEVFDDPSKVSMTGSFRVVGAQGQYVDFNVNENTTINDVVSMIQSTGLNANFDLDSQRIFISSQNTGALNNFNLVANDEGGMNALACLGLLSKDDLASEENQTWAAYQKKDASGQYIYNGDEPVYTDAFYDALSAEIKSRLEALQAENKALDKQNTDLTDANAKLEKDTADLLDSLTDDDLEVLEKLGALASGDKISDALEKLYGTKDGDGNYVGGLYDTIADKKAAYTAAQKDLADKESALQKAQEAYDAVEDSGDQDAIKAAGDVLDTAKKAHEEADEAYKDSKEAYDEAQGAYDDIADFLNDVVYGELVNKKVEGLEDSELAGSYYQLQDENGKALNVYEKLDADDKGIGEYYSADGTLLYKKVSEGSYVDKDNNALTQDGDGNYLDKDGNVVNVVTKYEYVQEREGGLKAEYEEAAKKGNVSEELQAKVDVINKLNNIFLTVGENRTTIAANTDKIESNKAEIKSNEEYISGAEDDADNKTATSELAQDVLAAFEAKVATAQKALEMAADEKESGMLAGAKIDAQDAEILIDGAKFTSMTNTFSVNGLTITANEETDKEVTMTTSTDTEGVYNMIKNFFTEYNKLINEMDSLYNAESSSGYEPLLSEEKEALSDSEVEEWEKKIKDSLLRRDTTLSSISFSMASALMQGAEVNGKMMYLSDFGINTLGYFGAKENERNAYHIDGDPDDSSTKANEDKLKTMIASDPETVMNFFSKLTTNLYDELTKKMAGTTLSSAMTVYNDKQMKTEYADYTDKIKKQEEKLNAMMDKWYAKFSAMEVAMSKLESRSSSLASILGG